MLLELRVETLLLIDRAELRFGPGLNAITGETGAGKTVLAHALDLLLGGKARGGIVRPGAPEAYVEGVFALRPGLLDGDDLADLRERLPDGADEIVLGRRVSAEGRTRAFVQGRSATAADLQEVGGRAGFVGTDTFTYRISDGKGGTDTATVTITVTPANRAPDARDDLYTVAAGQSIDISAPGVLANDTDFNGDPLYVTFSSQSGSSQGSGYVNPDGSLHFTTMPGATGTATITYEVTDTHGGTDTATVTINIVGEGQHVPIAANDSYTTRENTVLDIPIGGGILANDTDADPDGFINTVTLITPTDNGTITVDNGHLIYRPNAFFTGTDTATYRVTDQTGLVSNTATITITVTPGDIGNIAPTAGDDLYTVNSGESLDISAPGVLANDTDFNGDPLYVTFSSQPGSSQGTGYVNPDGSLHFTTMPGATGTATITYEVTDTHGGTDTATVTINIVGEGQHVPIAANDSYTTRENTVLDIPIGGGILANDTDADPDGFINTVTLITPTDNGTITVDNGHLIYRPNAFFTGTDTATYRVTDQTGLVSNTATITITVTPGDIGNIAPTAGDDLYTVNSGESLDISAPGVLANDIDFNGDPLYVTFSSQPGSSQGTGYVNPDGSLHFTTLPGATGTATITYEVTDTHGGTDTATVTINIVGEGQHVPIAANDSYTTRDDVVLDIPVGYGGGILTNDTDADNDPIFASVVTQPSHGTLVIEQNGHLTYTPDSSGFTGTDTATYRLTDQTGLVSNTATITITVVRGGLGNTPPEGTDDTYTTTTGTSIDIPAPGVLDNDTDIDGDPVFVTHIGQPSFGGRVSINPNGGFTYTPEIGFAGTDTFTYELADNHLGTDTATVTINVVPEGQHIPVANNDAYTTREGTALDIPAPGVLTNDADDDNDPIFVSVVNQPSNGTLVVEQNGHLTYTPNAGFHGTDTATYRVRDLTGLNGLTSAPATITITVTPNAAPEAVDDHYTTAAGTPLTVLPPGILDNDTDADGDTLTVTALGNEQLNGSLTVSSGGGFIYNPNPGFTGTDTLTYTVSDALGATDTGTLTITVGLGEVNHAPDAVNDHYTTEAGTPLTVLPPGILDNDTDADGDTLTVTALGNEQLNGSLMVSSGGGVIYNPNPGFSGTDTLTYTVSDGRGGTDTAAVTITVAPEGNSPPTAIAPPEVVSSDPNTGTIVGLLNVVDPDGDELHYTVIDGPARGAVTVNAETGAYVYTPSQAGRIRAGGAGPYTDSFAVTVSDNTNPSVTVAVNDLAIAPGPISTATVTAGDGATAVGVSPDGTRVYVANIVGDSISVIDTTTAAPTVIATIPVGDGPSGVAVSPNGERVYVTSQIDDRVTVLDTTAATPTVIATITVGDVSNAIALSPDGTRAYVVNKFDSTISVINTSSMSVIGVPITVGSASPRDVAVSPDGTRIYVTSAINNNVTVFDASTPTPTLIGTILVGRNPEGVTVNPDGTRAYVANFVDNTVSVIDTADPESATYNTVVSTIPVLKPFDAAVSPDGALLYVVTQSQGFGNDTVSVIDTATNTVIATVPVGSFASSVVADPDGTHVYVANLVSDNVTVITLPMPVDSEAVV